MISEKRQIEYIKYSITSVLNVCSEYVILVAPRFLQDWVKRSDA